jgi:predicted nucleotide-binding protein (sugar kinase/HSP70/actin superfamily)
VKYINCKGCDNYCKVSKLKFENGNFFYTGNRCENIFSNRGQKEIRGFNLVDFKLDLLFSRNNEVVQNPLLRIGIPRVLNMYENFPFWHKLMTECGIEVVISDNLSEEEHLEGSGTLMSDNICYPAKIAHTHIKNLINKKVDRIFYPFVSFEENEFEEMSNCFNCPVVSGYPDVIRSSMDPEKNHNIFFDTPNLNFDNFKFLKSNSYDYLKQFGIAKKVFSKAFDIAIEEKKRFKDALKTKAIEILITAEAENRKVFVLAQRPYQIDKAVNHGIPKMITDFGYDVITEDSLPYTEEDKLENINILTQWGYPNRLYKAAKWSLKYDNIEFIQLNSFGCGPDTIIIDEIKELMEEHGRNHAVLRIDEHSAPGSIKLRLRSLVESLKLQERNPEKHATKVLRKTTKPFTKDDKGRTIIVPFFSPFHSAYASAAFLTMGYNVEQLPQSSNESIDLGLKYVNNEICYPAILIIGDILRAIKSGKYDLNNLAVGITQTGGQCRASNYLSLIKKALVKNGYENIPVVGVSLSNQDLNYQPGFKLNPIRFVYQAGIGVFYGDAISRMYYSINPREKVKGSAKVLAGKYAELAQEAISQSNRTKLKKLLEQAVSEFNNVELEREIVPRIGVVGEIYVKYNPVGNNHTIEYLLEHGVEPVMPPLIDMFSQWFPNINIKNDLKIQKRPIVRTLSNLIENYYTKIEHEFDSIMRNFKFYITNHSIDDLANYASKVSNLGNHFFGEGWLIAGDILAFAKEGIYNVLCLQPFGCIANHIVAKGIEGKLKEVEPKLNILYLDIDSGVSPVNLHNRLYLLLKRAEKEAKEKELEVLAEY